jgi:hypothetical protein
VGVRGRGRAEQPFAIWHLEALARSSPVRCIVYRIPGPACGGHVSGLREGGGGGGLPPARSTEHRPRQAPDGYKVAVPQRVIAADGNADGGYDEAFLLAVRCGRRV